MAAEIVLDVVQIFSGVQVYVDGDFSLVIVLWGAIKHIFVTLSPSREDMFVANYAAGGMSTARRWVDISGNRPSFAVSVRWNRPKQQSVELDLINRWSPAD